MAGRPKAPPRPALTPCSVPPPPPELPEDQKAMWLRMARVIDLAGTFTLADLEAYRLAVRVWTAAEYVDLNNMSTADSKVIIHAQVWLAKFGITPSDRLRVPGSPALDDADLEFGGDGRRRFEERAQPLRVVKPADKKPTEQKKPTVVSGAKPPPWEVSK